MIQDPKTYQFDLTGPRPRLFVPDVEPFPGIDQIWPNRSSRRIFDPTLGIKAVVIHATAGSSSAGAVATMRRRRASWHWLVPDEDEPQHGQFVWECVPEVRAAWHVLNRVRHPEVNNGANRANHWSLGIEIVNSQRSNDGFSEWQVAATAQLVRYAWTKYPNLKHVVSHAKLDPDRRSDPGRQFPWNRFRDLVFDASGDPTPRELALTAPVQNPENPLDGPRGCCWSK